MSTTGNASNRPLVDETLLVEIPISRLSHEALDGLIDEFVTRDGTDYGLQEHTLAEKKIAVARLLERGEAVIVFDPTSEACNIIPKDGAN